MSASQMTAAAIGERLTHLRKKAGLSRNDVAAALSPVLDSSSLTEIEGGRKPPSWEILCALADFYRVRLDYFRGDDSQTAPASKGASAAPIVQPRFSGKNILVTGASQGIGEAVALRFAQEGGRVALNGRKRDKLIDVRRKMPPVPGGEHVIAPGDISKETEVEALMRDSLQAMGGLDVLVCNAGYQIASPSEEIRLEDFEGVMAVNVTGVMLCCRAALRYWREKKSKGIIIVNSSVHQQIPKPHYLGYSASKGAVGNIVRTLALEYARHDIRVNAVAPGAIVTPINMAWVDDPKQHKAVSSHIPMRRPGESEEIAAAISFLASEESSYITGQTLYVDGGLTLYHDFEKNWSS